MIDTDIGYSPISGHWHCVTDIVQYIPDIGVTSNIGTNIGMPDIGIPISLVSAIIETVSAIIETVVVERNIGGITSREDYIELRDASREAENVFLSKLQGTLQKNLTGLRKNVRDMVVKFFENDVE